MVVPCNLITTKHCFRFPWIAAFFALPCFCLTATLSSFYSYDYNNTHSAVAGSSPQYTFIFIDDKENPTICDPESGREWTDGQREGQRKVGRYGGWTGGMD